MKAEQQSGRFNGVIQTEDGPIEVKNGYAFVDREMILVSDDGVVATDRAGNIIAAIRNGRAVPLTPEIVNQLRQKGYIK